MIPHSRAKSRRRSRRSSNRCRAARSPARPGATSAPSFWSARLTMPCRWSTPLRPSTSRSRARMPSSSRVPHPQCGRDLSWRAYAGGDRRLCWRLQSCAADRALGAFLFGAGRARLHEAHLHPQMRARSVARAWSRRDRAGEAEGLDAHARSVAMRLNRAMSAGSPESQARPAQKDSNRLVAVTLDENSIGRSSPDVEHERAVAIYDLLEDNTFSPKDNDGGPFALHLSITGSRLMFDIRRPDGTPVDGASSLAVAAAAHREGLLHRLRQLLRGDPHRHARPHRGARHGPARASRRGLPHPDGAAQAQSHASTSIPRGGCSR